MGKKNPLPRLFAFYRRHRRMPSYGELQRLLGYRSKTAAVKLADKLVQQGFLQRDSAGKLRPSRRLLEVPLLGVVEAGFPSPAEEELLDTVSFDELLIGNKEATYVLKVKGDSMIEAGIMPGDLVLVERVETAKPGDIIIAQIDSEYTLKYLRRKGKKFYLEPANKKYEAFFPQEELKIVAVVKAVVRKY